MNTRRKVQIVLDDPETRAIWETAKRAAKEVAGWPAWKRGEHGTCARGIKRRVADGGR